MNKEIICNKQENIAKEGKKHFRDNTNCFFLPNIFLINMIRYKIRRII